MGSIANRPIKKWRSGNLEVAIWLNERISGDQKVEFKTASLTRSWKKKDENKWRSDVMNLRRTDIPKVILLLQKAQEDLYLTEDGKEDREEEEE